LNIGLYKYYYFIGIGGIGMSALARYFNKFGKKVSGYDKSESEITLALITEGIDCFYDENTDRLEKLLQSYKKEEILIVYTPAVPGNHSELLYLKNNCYTILKRAQVLGLITEQHKTIAISGTHGKTTTTTLVTHLLKTANINCCSFMGGISKNYNSNLLLPDKITLSDYMVVEADEYDRSFLNLSPYYTIMTSCDADHLDIYGNHYYVKEGFELFARKTKPEGLLIVNKNVDNELRLPSNKLNYSLNLKTDYVAENVRFIENTAHFNLHTPNQSIKNIELGITGAHNVENAVAACAVAHQLGIKSEVIKEALRSFKGVKRRFDYRIRNNNVIYIDDYAHHPEELQATISSVRKIYPDKKITGIFQPHLYSRTRDFADEFASSLDLLDEAILLEIYPAREEPIAGINSSMLLEKMKIKNKVLFSKDELLSHLKKYKKEVLLTMGAGDIDKLIQPIEALLIQK